MITVLCCCLVRHCYLHGALMTGMKEDRSCFWPLTGRRKHTNKNLYNASVRLCRVRNWHKGQNWNASLVRFAYTGSGFCFRLMEWEIQACKCNSALRSSIHSPNPPPQKPENHPFLFHQYKVFHKCAYTHVSFFFLALGPSNEWKCCNHLAACCYYSTSLWWAWKWLLGKVKLCTLAQLIWHHRGFLVSSLSLSRHSHQWCTA